MTAKISLVMTVYNREAYLEEAIASVLAQTFPDWELVIWDDGSTDRSPEIAAAYAQKDSRIRAIAAPHQGRGLALQSALALTTGPYLGWLDSDDRLAPLALAETFRVLAAKPEVGFVYTNYRVIDQQGRDRGPGKRCWIPYSKDRLLREFMTFHFRLIRRSVFEQVGGVDPGYETIEDYELCLRLSEVAAVYHLRWPLYDYRYHSASISQQRQAEQRALCDRAVREARDRRK